MNVSIILAHPSKNSFNHAIAGACSKILKERGHTVKLHDLYREEFDPVLSAEEIPMNSKTDKAIDTYCNEIRKCDGIIVIHPNWWGQPPAILKGWIDRVFRPGIAYEFRDGDKGEGVPVGLLNAKAAIVFNTSDTSREREENIFLDPLETIWKNCIFYLCGIKNFYRRMFRVMVTSTEEERILWLKEVEDVMIRYFPAEMI
ncbi:MAG: NAD(P)H-dependent oxidoreductase [Bacteroidales bacterium]|nr:NAD(P)H-dependent oxidoreductase [Bacteroidales bacterium]